MSLPLLHAGRTNPGLSAALDLRFALDKSLTAYRGPTPSFSRASTGTYFNSSGVLTSAAINAPRFDHTYNGTSWVSRGLLVEEQRTNLATNSQEFNSGAYIKEAGSVSANTATAPDGSVTADKFIPSATNDDHSIYQTFSPSTYAISVFAKADGYNYLFIGRDNTAANYGAFFDLVNGTVSQNTSGGTTSIINVGNGWFRCSISMSAVQYALLATSENGTSFVHLGDGTKGVLLWGYQVESGSFPTSYIPTTSASTTRSADVCQITGSDFSGFWNGTEGSVACEFDVSSGYTSSAMTIANFYQSGSSWIGFRSIESTSNNVFDCYSGGVQQARLGFSRSNPGISARLAAAFKANDFAASQNGSAVLTDTSGSLPSPTYLELGTFTGFGEYLNGHIARLRYFNKRLPNATLQLLSEPDPTLNLQFALNKSLTPVAGPAPSFSRASTGTYFNASGVLTSASINTPRFDHAFSGGQWVSRGLLLEEQRTNSLNYSEDFSNAYWFKFNSPTLTANTSDTISPDGTNSATKIVSGTTSETDIYKTGLYSGSSAITFSIYAKAGTSNFFGIGLNGGGYDFTVNFDLSNGTYNQRNLNGYTGTSISMTGVGNGWYRCSLTANNLSVSTGVYLYCCANSLSTSSTTSGNSNYLFGAQLEVGSFATSYIKSNSGSSTTRSADVCQITGTSFNWMWNQGEGSFAIECDRISFPSTTSFAFEAYSDTSNKILLENDSSADYSSVRNGGVDVVSWVISPAIQPNVSNKSALAYKANDFAWSRLGATPVTDTSGGVPYCNALAIGNRGAYGALYALNGHIAKLIYYPARLTNTKLQQLST